MRFAYLNMRFAYLNMSIIFTYSYEEFKPYIFKISDFMELLGVNTKTKYTEIPKITKDLMKKVFEIEEDDVIIQTAWLSSATYKKGSGIVELEFSPKLKPYMLKLNSMFTQYKLANILSMKSKYSPRIYEILKCNEFKKLRTKKELKKLSDIWFEFEEIKTGRKVTSIRFYIYSNNIENGKKVYNFKEEDAITLIDTQDLSEDDKIFELYNLFKEYKIGFESIKNILFNANGDIEKVKKVYEYSKTQDINNFVGFMISMVKKDTFITPKAKKKRKNTANFNERNYNYNELEKKLLGWD
ncbi:replication initiation protein (plasmid) [Clostridium perfringens]